MAGNGTRRLARWSFVISASTGLILVMTRFTQASYILRFGDKFLFLFSTIVTLALLLGSHWFGERRTLEGFQNLTLFGGALSLTVLLAEVGLRVVFAGITTTGDNSSYWARRWTAARVHLNGLGFRDREVRPQKLPGVYRIAVVGDSFTFGQGIEAGDRFTNRLERDLNGTGRRFEVLNFGQPGVETIDEVRILKQAVLGVHPDFILLQWYSNDVEGDDKSGRPRTLPLVPSEFVETFLHRNSVLYYILEDRWSALQQRLGWTETYEGYMRARFGDSASTGSREAALALAQFVALCRTQHIEMGIVLFPDLGNAVGKVSPLDFLRDRVLTECQRAGIDCLDLRRSVADQGRGKALMVNRFDGHPNAEVNRIAAHEILEHFGRIWSQGTPRQTATPTVSSATVRHGAPAP